MDCKRIRRVAKAFRKRRSFDMLLAKSQLQRSAQAQKLRRNMDTYDTLLKHSDITVPHTLPAKEWIDDFKQNAIDARSMLLQSALRGMAVLEGARQASRNLTLDYGFQMTLDSAELGNLVKKVAELDILYRLLQDTTLTPALRNKTIDYAAFAAFGPERAKTAMADMMRNLSVPEQSPFGAGNLLRMSDPQFTDKVEQMTGKRRLREGPSMVKLQREVKQLASDMRTDRRNRMLKP